jgi:hypothetical protein
MKIESVKYMGSHNSHTFTVLFTRCKNGWEIDCWYRNEHWKWDNPSKSQSASRAARCVQSLASNHSTALSISSGA